MKDPLKRKQTITVSVSGADLQNLEQMVTHLNAIGGEYTRSSLVREIIAFFVSKNGLKLFEAGLETSLDLFKDILPAQAKKEA